MFNYMWPIIMIIGASTFYQIAAKSTPLDINPFMAVFINYVVGAIMAFALFMLTSGESGFGVELSKTNWAPFVLGVSIVGIEVGSVYMYRAGWDVSVGSTVANIVLAVIIIFVGVIMYKEVLSVKQFAGIGLCIAGLILVNWK